MEHSNFIKKTPVRKSNILFREEENAEDFHEGIEDFEKIVIKMPLNSYEKKLILNFLTPGKKSKNL